MNDSIDFAALFEKNAWQLQTYLADQLPLNEDRVFARRSYEELLKNLNRRAQARGFEPNVLDPHYRTLFDAFVAQNVDAEARLRQREKTIVYERGRADVTMGIEFGIIPVPQGALPTTETIKPIGQAPISIDLAVNEVALTPCSPMYPDRRDRKPLSPRHPRRI
jgi:hypothetical protein